MPRHPLQPLDPLLGHPQPASDLLPGRLSAFLLFQLLFDTTEPAQALPHVVGQPNRAPLILKRSGNRLANPPGGVGAELVAPSVVEFLNRPDKAHIPLLNEIQEGNPLPHIPLGHAHHQTGVGANQVVASQFASPNLILEPLALPGRDPARLQPPPGSTAPLQILGQLHLLVVRQKRCAGHLPQVYGDWIVENLLLGDNSFPCFLSFLAFSQHPSFSIKRHAYTSCSKRSTPWLRKGLPAHAVRNLTGPKRSIPGIQSTWSNSRLAGAASCSDTPGVRG